MSSTPTEYGSASLATASAPDDDVSTASDDVTGDCGDAGELTAALLPAVNKKIQHGVRYHDTQEQYYDRIVPPSRLTTVGRRTFPVAASLLCNSLPSDIQSYPSLPVFCQRLNTFLFRFVDLFLT